MNKRIRTSVRSLRKGNIFHFDRQECPVFVVDMINKNQRVYFIVVWIATLKIQKFDLPDNFVVYSSLNAI